MMKDISAAIDSVTEDITQLEIQEESKPADDTFTITRNASIHCTIQSGATAVSSNRSNNFYMPAGLEALIEQKTAHKLKVAAYSRYDGKSKKRHRKLGRF